MKIEKMGVQNQNFRGTTSKVNESLKLISEETFNAAIAAAKRLKSEGQGENILRIERGAQLEFIETLGEDFGTTKFVPAIFPTNEVWVGATKKPRTFFAKVKTFLGLAKTQEMVAKTNGEEDIFDAGKKVLSMLG